MDHLLLINKLKIKIKIKFYQNKINQLIGGAKDIIVEVRVLTIL
jgi:hypothetical protein